MKKIRNFYDDSKITDKIKKMARKVTMVSHRIDDIPYNLAPGYEQEYWGTDLTYKGRKLEGMMYLMSPDLAAEPRIEYVLNSLFCNVHIYDKYKGNVFGLINDMPDLFGDFNAAEKSLSSLEAVAKGIHELFGDDYEIYKLEFMKINRFDEIIK